MPTHATYHVNLVSTVRAAHQISRSPLKLAWPSLPTMMWSCTEMPRGFATSMMDCVIWMSAREGVGSPEGWLCTRMTAVALSSSARLTTSWIDGGVIDSAGLLHL